MNTIGKVAVCGAIVAYIIYLFVTRQDMAGRLRTSASTPDLAQLRLKRFRALSKDSFSLTRTSDIYFPPSGAVGHPLPRKGHVYGFNRTIIFDFPSNVKFFFPVEI